ncbi:MAG: prepilin-type N-terminal cleavage/methylation domain-containing protein [Elusimicrobiota bacterium]|jgi:prepilin-type N-terminal cleavage/methylation domain-containing protein
MKRGWAQGYTLIELMIIVAIVGVLASILVRVIPYAQYRAHDKARLYHLSSLRHVIELYRADMGAYPAAPAGPGSFYTLFTENDGFAATVIPNQITSTNYIPGIVPTYYEALPVDPSPGASTLAGCSSLGYKRTWAYFSNGDHYKLVLNCAPEAGFVNPDDSFADPASCLMGECTAWAVSDAMDYTTFTLGWQ